MKSKDISKFNMRDPETQKLISEKSGIPITRWDNLDGASLRRKIQLAAMEIAKKNEQRTEQRNVQKTEQKNVPASKRSVEKPKGKTYNRNVRIR